MGKDVVHAIDVLDFFGILFNIVLLFALMVTQGGCDARIFSRSFVFVRNDCLCHCACHL